MDMHSTRLVLVFVLALVYSAKVYGASNSIGEVYDVLSGEWDEHPFEGRVMALTDYGDELHQVYYFSSERDQVVRHDITEETRQTLRKRYADQIRKRSPEQFASPKDKRETIRNLFRMNLDIYERTDYAYDFNTQAEYAYFLSVWNDTSNYFKDENVTFDDYSRGKQTRKIKDEVGVSARVYKNINTQSITLVFRGSWSDADFNQVLVWYGDWLIHTIADRTLAAWKSLGFAESEVSSNPSWVRENFYIFLYNIGYSSTVGPFYTALQSINYTETEAKTLGYFKLVRTIVDDILSKTSVSNVVLTGHSLGGALAQLASIYISETRLDPANFSRHAAVPTIVFSSANVRCLVKKNGWGLNDETDYPQIVNYYNGLDPVPLPEEKLGTQCPFSVTPEAKADCKSTVNVGIDGYLDSTLNSHNQHCRYRTHFLHSIYAYVVTSDTYIDANGTSDLGCFVPTPVTCPTSFSTPSSVGGFVFIFFVIPLIIIIFLIGVCIRFCYIKAKGKRSAVIFPCCGCCCDIKPCCLKSDKCGRARGVF